MLVGGAEGARIKTKTTLLFNICFTYTRKMAQTNTESYFFTAEINELNYVNQNISRGHISTNQQTLISRNEETEAF